MPPSRVLAAVATLAVVGGLAVAVVAGASPEAARLPGGGVAVGAGPGPEASPSQTPTRQASGFTTLAPEDLPTPDVPDAEAVRRVGPNDASIPVPVSGVEASPGDRPAQVRIPAIGVDSRLVDLGIAEDGTMEVPSDFSRAGWLTAAPAPGQRGPAVIAGHVDSRDGPAVFFRLRELVPGDTVEVVQRDGDVVRFTVRSLQQFAKDEFPTDLVYGPVAGPVLRLITCSGEIDRLSGHYTDNTVVFAS